MATAQYHEWVRRGRPFDLAQPIAQLEAWADANGIPVLGTIGNETHLTADRPQDHTPFSFTEWPVQLSSYIVCAIDLANVNGLGQRIEDAARAGKLPWLKYMNHSGQHLDSRDLDGDGKTWEEYPSSDEHVHLSIRTDWVNRPITATLAYLGGVMELTGKQATSLDIIDRRLHSVSHWLDTVTGADGTKSPMRLVTEVNKVNDTLTDLRAILSDIRATQLDQSATLTAILTRLDGGVGNPPTQVDVTGTLVLTSHGTQPTT